MLIYQHFLKHLVDKRKMTVSLDENDCELGLAAAEFETSAHGGGTAVRCGPSVLIAVCPSTFLFSQSSFLLPDVPRVLPFPGPELHLATGLGPACF